MFKKISMIENVFMNICMIQDLNGDLVPLFTVILS